MERIKSIYSSFSRYEQRTFKTYLTAFHNKGENKALTLVQMIEKSPEMTRDAAAAELYGDPKSKAFLMLKARLYEKMTEFLTLSITAVSRESETSDPSVDAMLEYRKCMLAATSLRARGLKPLASENLSRAIEIAREIACPELELDPLLRLKALSDRRRHPDDENPLFKELSDAMARQEMDMNAIAIYHHFMEHFQLKTGYEAERIKYLEDNLPMLEQMLANKFSARALFYILNMKVTLLGMQARYVECRQQVQALIDLINSQKGLQGSSRRGAPYMQLCVVETILGDTAAAFQALDEAERHTKGLLGPNYLVRQMRCFVTLFAEQMEESDKILTELEQTLKAHTLPNHAENLMAATYLRANWLYMEGKPQRAWQKLQEIQDLNHDKMGWHTGIRIFEIMLLIEIDEVDMASLKLEALRKHLFRYNADERSKHIFRFLTAMERSSYDFHHIKNEEELMQAIASTRWTIFGHEVTRFETWFEKNKNRKK